MLKEYFELSKQSDRIIMIRYEDLKERTKETFKKLANFLGKPNASDELLEKVIAATAIDEVRHNENLNYSWLEKCKVWRKDYNEKFIRKGIVGDWRNFFKDETLLREFNDYINENIPKELIYDTGEESA